MRRPPPQSFSRRRRESPAKRRRTSRGTPLGPCSSGHLACRSYARAPAVLPFRPSHPHGSLAVEHVLAVGPFGNLPLVEREATPPDDPPSSHCQSRVRPYPSSAERVRIRDVPTRAPATPAIGHLGAIRLVGRTDPCGALLGRLPAPQRCLAVAASGRRGTPPRRASDGQTERR